MGASTTEESDAGARLMAIGKRKRFEVFARDGFTCQYCGRRPPEVVLEVDHIHPQSADGSDDDVNLITSCFDCNRGKAARLPGSFAPRPDADLKYLQLQQEIVEVDRYLEAKKQREVAFERLAGEFEDTWLFLFPSRQEYCPTLLQWKVWLGIFSPDEIENAMKIASASWASGKIRDVERAIRYVSGVLHNVRRECA